MTYTFLVLFESLNQVVSLDWRSRSRFWWRNTLESDNI